MKKILLLFGASGDLGLGAARYFLTKDYSAYYFFARKNLSLDSHGRIIKQVSVENLADENSVKTAFAQIEIDKTTQYFLFSTVGAYSGGKPIAETSYEEFLKMQNINLNISFLISKYFVRLASEAAGGSICFTSALSSFTNEKNKIAYNLSKNSLNYLVQSLSSEGIASGISANAVAPFIIDTPENREWVEDYSTMVKPADIAEVVHNIFLNYNIISGNIIKLPGTIRR